MSFFIIPTSVNSAPCIFPTTRWGWAFLSVVIVLATVLTFPTVMYPITSGLDSSGGFAMNKAFAEGLIFGKQLVHSYGPLGFMVSPQLMGHNVAWALSLHWVAKVAFGFGLIALSRRPTTPTDRWWHPVLSLILMLVVWVSVTLNWLLMLLVLISALLFFETNQRRWMVMAAVVSAMGLMIKPTVGVVGFSMVGCSALVLGWRHKSVLPILHLAGLSLGCIGLIWLMLYHSFAGVTEYLTTVVYSAKGYGSAHTQNPVNNWWLLSFFFISWLALPFWEKNQRVSLFFAIGALGFVMFWKYAMGRQDHIHLFFNLLILFYVLLVLYARVFSWRLIVSTALTFCFLLANMNVSGFSHIKLVGLKENLKGLSHFSEWVNWQQTVETTREETRVSLERDVLPKNVLKIIGDKTVDVYPWEAAMVSANKLHWSPRPSFQSHMVVGPYFDNRNEAFLSESTDAPDYILWEREHRGGPLESIDHRYLLNDDPKTIQAILTHYTLTTVDGNVAVFQRNDSPHFLPEVLHEDSGVWGEWMMVPAVEPHQLIRLRVTHHPHWLQQLKRTLYKENDSYIEYQLADGAIKKHRLFTDNMRHGLWVNPYVTSIDSPFVQGESVVAVRLTHSPSDWFDHRLDLVWEEATLP